MLALGLVALMAGCSAVGGDAPLPNGEGTISVDNPIERGQVQAVTAEGRAVTTRLVDALVGGGMVVDDESFQYWESCMSAKQTAVGYNPQNGVRYQAWIYLTPKTDIAKPTRLVKDIGEGWETKDGSSQGRSGVFSLDLSIMTTVQLLVMSPCYFVRKVDKSGLAVDELDSLGAIGREPWVQ